MRRGLVSRVRAAGRRLVRRLVFLGVLGVVTWGGLTALHVMPGGSSAAGDRPTLTGWTARVVDYMRDDVPAPVGLTLVVLSTCVGTPLMATTAPVNVGAGAVYGVTLGTCATLIGTTAGAWVCFVIARFWAREWVQRKIRESTSLTALDHALVRGGAGIVMLSRLSPLFPFAMTSFAYGACAVTTKDFLLGTAVGLTPGTAMMSWVGYSLRKYSTHRGELDRQEADARQLWGTVGLTLVSGLLLGWRVNRIVKSTAAAVSASGAKASSRMVRGGSLSLAKK